MCRPARLKRTPRRRTTKIPAGGTCLEQETRRTIRLSRIVCSLFFITKDLKVRKVRRAFQVFVRGHFERSAWRIFSKFLRREIMPKTPRKLTIVRMSARACIVGLLLNSFAIANSEVVWNIADEGQHGGTGRPGPSIWHAWICR